MLSGLPETGSALGVGAYRLPDRRRDMVDPEAVRIWTR
jgi:hypothetical protein